MPNHNKASIESKQLCDNLLEELRAYLPNVTRSEANNTCGIYATGRNRFAYVYHRTKGKFIRVYFRGDVSVALALKAELTIAINVRPKVVKGWDKEFPYYVEINNHEDLQSFAKILSVNAYPLSEKKSRKTQNPKTLLPEELPEVVAGKSLFEGVVKRIKVNVYERNPTARIICTAHYGYSCQICGFDFEKVYGEIGRKIIHVHHILPLSQIKDGYHIDPIKDLIPVCPNCHAVIHHQNPAMDINLVKKMVIKRGGVRSDG